jgi:hypothetical protein
VSNTAQRRRVATLSLRGFPLEPNDVARQFGLEATTKGARGEPTKSRRSTYRSSFVEFSVELAVDARIVDMIPALVAYLGGVDKVLEVIRAVQPEEVMIELLLPIRFSDSVEDGYIDVESISAAHRMRAGIGFLIP